MGHVVLAAAQRALHPGVHNVEGQRRMDADGRVQAARRVPGLVSHTGHKLAHGAGALQRQRLAIAGDHIAALVEPLDMHFHALK